MIWRCPLSRRIHARFKYDGFGRRHHQIPAYKRERGGVAGVHLDSILCSFYRKKAAICPHGIEMPSFAATRTSTATTRSRTDHAYIWKTADWTAPGDSSKPARAST